MAQPLAANTVSGVDPMGGAAQKVWIDNVSVPTSGGGGGGDASAANQASQITQETATAGGVGTAADAIVAAGAAGSLSAKLRRVTQALEDLKTLQVLAAGENHVGAIGGATAIVSDSFSRPANTTAYTAGDAVSATTSNSGTTALRSLAGSARINQGSGYLTKLRLWTNQAANVARFRVHFYTVAAPASAVVGDNAPMTLLFANAAQRVGSIDLAAMTTEQSGSDAAHSADFTTRLAFKCAAADSNLYYRLETLDGFTPASAQSFFLEIATEQN